jgi:phage antirepressor YoqD-like protein
MSNLTNFERFDADGLELVVNTTTGLAYASISATARMLNLENIQVKRALEKGGYENVLITAEIPTAGGVQGGTKLVDSGTIFNLAIQYNIPLAKTMGAAGANLYLLKLAGYQTKIVEQTRPEDLTRLEILQMGLEAEKGRLAALAENEKLQAQLEAAAPLVEYAEAVQASDTSIDIGTYAKMINTGRNRLFADLRQMKIVMQNSTLHYQRFVDAGYFEVSQELDTADGRLIPFALLTGKGQLWLSQKISERKKFQSQMVKAITSSVQLDLDLGFDG